MKKVYVTFDHAVARGVLTKESAAAYKANITRQHNALAADRSLTPAQIGSRKAAVTRRITANAGL